MMGFAIGALVIGQRPTRDFRPLPNDKGRLGPADRVEFARRDNELALTGRARHFDRVRAPDTPLTAPLNLGD